MNREPMRPSRRGFLKRSALGAFALALDAVSRHARAQEHKPRLDESDPQAESLGYKHDAANVDKKKFPTYKPGETCSNCQLFQSKSDKDEWAPCPIFPGKQVNANGWCSSYMKRTT